MQAVYHYFYHFTLSFLLLIRFVLSHQLVLMFGPFKVLWLKFEEFLHLLEEKNLLEYFYPLFPWDIKDKEPTESKILHCA